MKTVLYLSAEEPLCSLCRRCKPNEGVIYLIDLVSKYKRDQRYPFILSTSYVCDNHPEIYDSTLASIEVKASGEEAYEMVQAAMEDPRIGGIGISQNGFLAGRFLHFNTEKVKSLWTY